MPSREHRGVAGRRRPFSVLHQKLVLRIDAAQSLASGFTELTLKCLEDFKELQLHCRQMRVRPTVVFRPTTCRILNSLVH